MGSNTTRKIVQGFLPYDSDDESVLLTDPLTSANPDTTNVTDVGAGGVFDAGGISFATISADGQKYDLQGMGFSQDELFRGMTVTVWIESGILDHSDTVDQMPVSFYSGTGNTEVAGLRFRTLANTANDYSDIALDNGQFASRYNSSSVGKDDYVRLDFCIHRGKALLYIDYLLVASCPMNTGDIPDADTFRYFALGFHHANVLVNGSNYKMKNLMISKKVVSLPTHPSLINVLAFGDSMLNRGGFPDGSINNTNNSDQIFAYEDAGSPQGVSFKDSASLPVIQRELSKAGMHIGVSAVSGQNGALGYNAVKNYCTGGSGIETTTLLSTDITLALTTDNQYPSIAIIWIGSNDVTQGTVGSSNITLDASWKASYSAQIDLLIAKGATNVFVCNVVDLNDTDFYTNDVNTAYYQDRISTINTLIGELETDISEVTIVDLHALFGGETPVASYYSADLADRHPSSLGSVVAGKEIARIIKTKIK